MGVDIHGPEGANSISLSTRPPVRLSYVEIKDDAHRTKGEYYNDFDTKPEHKVGRSKSTNSNGALEVDPFSLVCSECS